MPRRDQTGPLGEGALTGRQLGSCSDLLTSSFYGFRRGRGRRNFCQNRRFLYQNNTQTLQEEKEYLKNRLEQIEQELKQ